MFFDSFETPSGVWIQGCISFPYLGEKPGFADALSGLLSASGMVPLLDLAFRIRLTTSGELWRTLIFLAPRSSETSLRRFIATFSRLEIVTPGSVEFPQDAVSLDQHCLGAFPKWHCRAVPTGFGRGRAWFASHFRVANGLDQLALEARGQKLGVSYQIQACRFEERTQALHDAKHNLIEMESLPGLPVETLRLQQQLVERLANASYLLEEMVGVEQEAGQVWLATALDRLFATRHARLAFGQSGFTCGDYSDVLAAGFHSSRLNSTSPDEVCTMAAGEKELRQIITWTPNAALAMQLTPVRQPSAEVGESAPDISGTPSPYMGSEPFVFVSYKHSDLSVVAPYLRELSEAGVRFWYDRGIPGASEWMQVLEERIERAQLLLIFLSQAAVDSKYVRREILMADTLNKPILTLTIGKPELRWGLKLLLPQYQMEQLGGRPLQASVQRAVAASCSRFP